MWVLLALLLLASPAWAGQLDATWSAPTTFVDGSPLTDPSSLTYRLYWVLFPQTPCPGTQFIVTSPGQTTANLGSLTQGMTYNAQVTAVTTGGVESACSLVASGVARASAAPVLTPGSNLRIVFVPSPPGPDFTLVGLTVGQVVTGALRVQAVPSDGTTTGNHFRFDLLNSSGQGAVVGGAAVGNDEFATPYCFIGDPGQLPCSAFDTASVPNGSYSLRILYTKTGQPTSVVKLVPFTVSN